MIKSRAAVAFEAGKPLEIVEVDVAPPKAGEVLICTAVSSLAYITVPVSASCTFTTLPAVHARRRPSGL